MKKQIGVWIDAKQALIVFLDEEGQRISTVLSSGESRVRIPGEGKWFTRMGNQFLNFDKKKQARQEADSRDYFKQVTEAIASGDELVIFGPAAKKNELKKYLDETGVKTPVVVSVETADSMTENQVAAWVKKYFNR